MEEIRREKPVEVGSLCPMPTKNVIILVVTVTGRGDNPSYKL